MLCQAETWSTDPPGPPGMMLPLARHYLGQLALQQCQIKLAFVRKLVCGTCHDSTWKSLARTRQPHLFFFSSLSSDEAFYAARSYARLILRRHCTAFSRGYKPVTARSWSAKFASHHRQPLSAFSCRHRAQRNLSVFDLHSQAFYPTNMGEAPSSILAVSESANHRVHPGTFSVLKLADSFRPP